MKHINSAIVRSDFTRLTGSNPTPETLRKVKRITRRIDRARLKLDLYRANPIQAWKDQMEDIRLDRAANVKMSTQDIQVPQGTRASRKFLKAIKEGAFDRQVIESTVTVVYVEFDGHKRKKHEETLVTRASVCKGYLQAA